MKPIVFVLLISELVFDFNQASAPSDDIVLFDFFSAASIDGQDALSPNNSTSLNLLNLSDQYEINNSSSNWTNSPEASSGPSANHAIGNQTNNHQNMINEPNSAKSNFKLKKQKLFFGKKLLLWKRNVNRGYGAFLMLCEPDVTCVTPQTKLGNQIRNLHSKLFVTN